MKPFISLFLTISIALFTADSFKNYNPGKVDSKGDIPKTSRLNMSELDLEKIHAIDDQEPLKIDWEVLTDINYKVRYFESLDMDINAPLFGKAQKALDGKEVIITGFVIPFDENMEYLSLSANPYASCFFCGNASQASIISMYMKDGTKRYQIDDFKTFKGTLHLNYDDPNEFIYILKNAEEVSKK